MAVTVGSAEVEIVADVSKVEKTVVDAFDDAGKKAANTFDKSVDEHLDTGTSSGGLMSKMKSAGSGLGTSLLGGFGGAMGAQAVFGAMKGFADAAKESEKVAKLTEQVIKATGGEAGITTDHIDKLTQSLSKKAGMDDEAIQSGENLLLQFTGIKNAAGEGNDVFDRTTALMVDMAAKMGTDPVSAATKLGKAMNTPAEAIAKLKKEGIDFTEEQENMVKAMVESGDTMGAQKYILDALESRYKGAAEAQATDSDRMKIAMENLQEQIGAKLLPAFEKFAMFVLNDVIPVISKVVDWISANLVPAIRTAAQWFGENVVPPVQRAIERIQAIVSTVFSWIERFWNTWGGTILGYFERLWASIQKIVEGAMKVIQGVIDVVMGLIHGDFSRVWDGIKGIFSGAVEFIAGIFEGIVNEIRTRIEIITRVLSGIGDALWSGIEAAWNASIGRLIGWITGLADRVVEALAGAGEWLVDIGTDIITGLWDAMQAAWDTGVEFLTGMAGRAVSAVGDLAKTLYDAGAALLRGLWDGIKWLWEAEVRGWLNIAEKVKEAVGALGEVLFDAGKALLTGLWNGLKWFWETEVRGWLNIGSKVVEVVGNLADTLTSKGSDIISGFLGGMKKGWSEVTQWVAGIALSIWNDFSEVGKSIVGGIASGVRGVVGFVGDFASGLGNGIIDFINANVIDFINRGIPNSIPMPSPIPDIPLPDNPIPRIPNFHTGGVAPSDMLAILRRDEVIFTPDQLNALGAALGGGGGGMAGPQINVTIGAVHGTRDGYGVGRTIAMTAMRTMMMNGYATTARKGTSR